MHNKLFCYLFDFFSLWLISPFNYALLVLLNATNYWIDHSFKPAYAEPMKNKLEGFKSTQYN